MLVVSVMYGLLIVTFVSYIREFKIHYIDEEHEGDEAKSEDSDSVDSEDEE